MLMTFFLVLAQFSFNIKLTNCLLQNIFYGWTYRGTASPRSLEGGWTRGLPCWRSGCRGWWGYRSSRGSSSWSWWWRWCPGTARGSTRTSPRSSWPGLLKEGYQWVLVTCLSYDESIHCLPPHCHHTNLYIHHALPANFVSIQSLSYGGERAERTDRMSLPIRSHSPLVT